LHTCQPEPGALLFLPLVLGGFDSDRNSGDIAADACSAFHRSAVGHKLDSRDQHDGFRLMARRDPMGIRLITRRGKDWTNRYPLVVEAVHHLKVRSCLIDGEVVCCDAQGVTGARPRIQDTYGPRHVAWPAPPKPWTNSVRRQRFWDRRRPNLRESLAHSV
jgi:hypothetical protein